MAKALKSVVSVLTKSIPGCRNVNTVRHFACTSLASSSSADSQSLFNLGNFSDVSRRNLCSLSSSRFLGLRHINSCKCAVCTSRRSYSSEVDKELSGFLDKEIAYEVSRAAKDLPQVPGFEIATDGGDVTLTKSTGSEKITVRLSVNGSVDAMVDEGESEKPEETNMVCRPPFEVEISKGDGTTLAFQCSFPRPEDPEEFKEADPKADVDDQFEINEFAIHNGEWKNQTYTVSAATLDAELFELLFDMLDERGIDDKFIAHLVDFCTAYENQKYIGFLKELKSFVK